MCLVEPTSRREGGVLVAVDTDPGNGHVADVRRTLLRSPGCPPEESQRLVSKTAPRHVTATLGAAGLGAGNGRAGVRARPRGKVGVRTADRACGRAGTH